MKNKLYVFLLIPMAFAMTSFNIQTLNHEGRSEMASNSDPNALKHALRASRGASGGLISAPSLLTQQTGTTIETPVLESRSIVSGNPAPAPAEVAEPETVEQDAEASDAGANEVGGQNVGTSSVAEGTTAVEVADEQPEEPAEATTVEVADADEPEEPVADNNPTTTAPANTPIAELIQNMQKVVSGIGPTDLPFDVNGDRKADTHLKVSFEEVTSSGPRPLNVNSGNDEDKVILKVESNTFESIGLEAESGVSCECDNEQSFQIELTRSDLGLEPGEDLDEEKIKKIVTNHADQIIAQINNNRNAQHQASLEEQDCSKKGHKSAKLRCFIKQVKDNKDKDESLATIEEILDDLAYSTKKSDERLFEQTLKKLKGDEDLVALKEKFEKSQEVRVAADEHKEKMHNWNKEITEATEAYNTAENYMAQIEMRGFSTPMDQHNYQIALQNMRHAETVMYSTQLKMHTARRAFNTHFNSIVGNLSSSQVTAARNYAFPKSLRNNMAVIPSSSRFGLSTTLGGGPLSRRPLRSRNFRDGSFMDRRDRYSLRTPSILLDDGVSHRSGRNDLRGGGYNIRSRRGRGVRTPYQFDALSRPRDLNIDRVAPRQQAPRVRSQRSQRVPRRRGGGYVQRTSNNNRTR